MPAVKPVSLDGSALEGGGQLVRVALCLSSITGIPVHVYNIRANRAPQGRASHNHGRGDRRKAGGDRKVEGGLKESHLAALVFLAHHCNAYVAGAEIGSREITFIPGAGSMPSASKSKPRGGKGEMEERLVDFENKWIKLRNPGSVWLILQALLPYLLFCGSRTKMEGKGEEMELVLMGGTNVSKSMSSEYVRFVLLPTLESIGLKDVQLDVLRRGWAGNAAEIGEVRLRVPRVPDGGLKMDAFQICERGEVEKIVAYIVAGTQNVRHRLETGIRKVIFEYFGEEMKVDIDMSEESGGVRRMYILLVAHTTRGRRLGRDYLGTGRKATNDLQEMRMIETGVESAVRDLKHEINRGGCLDEYMQDQLVIFQALAHGKSVVYAGERQDVDNVDRQCGDEGGSLHTRTVRWVCESMSRKMRAGVRFEAGGVCHGLGRSTASENEIDRGEIRKLASLHLSDNEIQ